MAGTSKRRSRVSHPSKPIEKPANNEWEKEDEELELEQQLFGRSKKRVRSNGDHGRDGVNGVGNVENAGDLVSDDEVASEDDFGDLFTVDAPLAQVLRADDGSEEDGQADESDEDSLSGSGSENDPDSESDDDESSNEDEDEDEDEEDEDSGPEFDGTELTSYIETGPNAPQIEVPAGVIDLPPSEEQVDHKGKKRAIWHDPSDDLVSVDLESDNRLKKLARGKKGTTVNGEELMKRLRKQYETLHPRPDWADRRTAAGTPSLSTLLSSTKSFIDTPSSASIIKGQKKRGALKAGTIDMQRLRNANHQNPTTGKREASNGGSGVVDLAWHPSERVGVLAVAGGDRRIRFFNIDGHTNPSLMTLHIPSLPLTKSTFHPSGSSILFTGTRPYYYTYDLPSQRCLRSPRNLFGSVPDPTSPNTLTTHRFSPDGSMLAVAGRRGAVSVLDWSNVGVGAVIADLRSGRGGAVAALDWNRDGTELSVLGGRDGAEVEVWNVGERKVIRKWRDDRAYGGTIMESNKGGEYTAIGSTTGIVNVYSSSSISARSLDLTPEPLRSLEHLTTPITSMAFHPSSELLVTASKTKRDQLKLYHLPSMTAYQNFPAINAPYKRISSLGFSANGEYLASGNQQGAVLLYRVKHYRSL